jgi:hypothetical protein
MRVFALITARLVNTSFIASCCPLRYKTAQVLRLLEEPELNQPVPGN